MAKVIKLEKSTYNDLRKQANDAGLGYFSDFDEQYIYFETWEWSEEQDRGYEKTYKYLYTWSEGLLSIDINSKSQVERSTSYVTVESPIEKRLGLLEKFLTPFISKKEEVLKQFDNETYNVREVLYIPAGWVDGHGATLDESGVENLIKAFNEGVDAGTIQPSLFHKTKTKTFDIGTAWYLKKATVINGKEYPAYTPMVDITFKSKKAFDARVSGKLSGLSIGALGLKEKIQKALLEPNHKLVDFSFLFKGAHLSYTDWSVGGAASMINDGFEVVEKSMKEPLTKGQEELLELLEEEYDPIDKQLNKKSKESCATAPSTSVEAGAQDAGVDNKTLINKGNETGMVDEVKNKEAEELRKELEAFKKAVKIEKSLTKYNLDAELSEELSVVMAKDEASASVITKALDAVISASEAKLEEVEKSLEQAPAAKDPLYEKVNKEIGHNETQEEVVVEKSAEFLAANKFAQRMAKYSKTNDSEVR